MKKKNANTAPIKVVAIIVIIAVIFLLVNSLINKNSSSNKKVSEEELAKMYRLYEGYTADGDKVNFDGATKCDDTKVAILLNNQLVDDKAIVENGKIYVEFEFVKNNLNSRFYWDNNENILIFTTPTDVIKADVGSTEYYVTKVKNSFDNVIVKTEGTKVYVSIDYVKQYSNVDYSFYDSPNRVCITRYNDEDVDTAVLKKNSKIRIKSSAKSNIVYTCPESTTVYIVDAENKWSKVVTENGYFGYIENKSLTKKTTVTVSSDFVEPEYTSIKKEGTISLGWHMVTSYASNDQLVDLVTSAKGLDVVAPTWFRLSDNDGNISSLADANYVTRAHLIGLEVWASIDDQSSESNNKEIFTYTSKREKIINQLIATAIEDNIDGISVDFEYIAPEIADDYIEFLRELSVKCRINGIVLSVDDRVPEASNAYYNIKEQGIVADYVIMMGYDEYWGADSGAGSTASLPWVTTGIETMVNSVPADKVILAIPFYTRVWEEDQDGNVTSCSSVDMTTAMTTLTSNGVTPTWVDNFGQYYGEFTSGTKTTRIWVEDSQSIEEKLKLLNTYNLAGVGAWRLGLENADLWNTIIKYTN